jgi:CHAT domain-containing protein/Tfp pilus assembly protein PilF
VLGSDELVAISLNELALLLKKQGYYALARPLYERALAIMEEEYGPYDRDHVAVSLNNLAKLLEELGLYEEALPLYDRALTIWEETLGPEHPEIATGLNNLAILHRRLGRGSEARSLYERALRIKEKHLGPDHPDVATRLNNLGLLLYDEGQYAEAQPLYERALVIWENAWGSQHPDVASCLNNMALLYHDQGEYYEARPLYERALAIRNRLLEPDHPDVTDNVMRLVSLLSDIGDNEHAGQLARDAYDDMLNRVGHVLPSLTEQESYRYLRQISFQLNTLLSVAQVIKDPVIHTRAYEDLLRWKSQVARLRWATRQRLQEGLTSEQRDILSAIRETQSKLSALVWAEGAIDAERESRIQALHRQSNDLELSWQRTVELEHDLTVSWEFLRESLPKRTAVVDFFVHRVFRPVEDRKRIVKDAWSRPALSVWITRSDSEFPMHVNLGVARPIEESARALLEEIVVHRGVELHYDRPDYDELNKALYGLLWEPVMQHLGDVDLIVVSPDGFLGTLAFEVLRDTNNRYLLEQHAFVYMQDVTSIARIETTPADYHSLVSVGGVDFGDRGTLDEDASPRSTESEAYALSSNALRGSFDYWQSLPATSGESQAVVDLHKAAFPLDGRRTLRQREQATEEVLKIELPRRNVAHLATHGFFQPEGLTNMWEEALNESGESDMRMREPLRRLVGNHPGLLSGLVCAGANSQLEAGRDDGYLTAEEVAWLDLSRVELIVLSACQTGLGRAQSGEGLIGLRRAFRNAGARTVISSLWSIRDESTADLMRLFYKNLWTKGMGKHEALRSAQLEMLKRNRIAHQDGRPSTWGAFVLSGDWR